jgi:hypothetical protein
MADTSAAATGRSRPIILAGSGLWKKWEGKLWIVEKSVAALPAPASPRKSRGMSARPAALAVFLFLAGCGPPEQEVLNRCRASVAPEIKGRGLISSDVAELIQACMLSKGFALRETGARCPDALQTATDRRCYYPDTAIGRLTSKLGNP